MKLQAINIFTYFSSSIYIWDADKNMGIADNDFILYGASVEM